VEVDDETEGGIIPGEKRLTPAPDSAEDAVEIEEETVEDGVGECIHVTVELVRTVVCVCSQWEVVSVVRRVPVVER
jgi:hypothetical protein